MKVGYKNFAYAAYKMNTRFYVRSVGNFQLEEGEELPVKRAEFPEIFWCVSGTGSLVLDGRHYLLRPGQVWYYPTGSSHQIACHGKSFHYCWITLDGPDAGVLFDGLNLKAGVNQSRICPQHLFNKVLMNIELPQLEIQLENLKTAFEILTLASSSDHPEKPDIVEQAIRLIEENYHNPDLNVEKISAWLNVNRSILSRMFSSSQKTTIVQFLSSCRLKKALYLIKQTDTPINQIAEICGYSCHNYFTKVIRRHTGFPPAELRRME